MERAVACDTERDRSWVWEATRVEQGTRAEGHNRAATRCLCCVQAAGYRQRETDKREEAQEVKGKEEKES